jgi:hypothetical protein
MYTVCLVRENIEAHSPDFLFIPSGVLSPTLAW